MAENNSNKPIENASEVVERFGGIRPMSKKSGVAVTTIQGWKKRDTIPANRRQSILDAAAQHGIKIDDILAGGGAAGSSAKPDTYGDGFVMSTTPEDEANQTQHPEQHQKAEHLPAMLAKTGSQGKGSMSFDEQFAALERQAVRKSTWINFALLVIGIIIIGVLFVLTQKINQEDAQRINQLEENIGALKDDLSSVKSDQSFLSTMIPKDLDQRIAQIQDQATQAQQKVNEAIAMAGKVSDDLMKGNTKQLNRNMAAIRGEVERFMSPQTMELLAARLQTMTNAQEGQAVLDKTMTSLSSYFQTQEQSGSEASLEKKLAQAKESIPEVGAVFEGVPQEELKAAALLLALTQFRDSLNRGNKPFNEDLEVLKSMLGEDSPELTAAIDKLSPSAEEGVLTPQGLQREFRTVAGDAVVASLKGEDVSMQERMTAKLNEMLQIEKDGEPVSGTETQIKIRKAEKELEAGNVEEAISIVETLDGPARDIMADWTNKARMTLLAHRLEQKIQTSVNSVFGDGMQGLQNLISGEPANGGRLYVR